MRYLTITILLAVFNICFAFNPSSGFLEKPIQRNTEVEFNCYLDDSTPQSIMWDINADGEYDTTTTEQTLVYDFGSYDTTQVIVKVVFDSLTFTIDTTQIALFDNIISLNYDTLWVCTLATSNFEVLDHQYSVSDSGETAVVKVESPSCGCNAHYLIHNGMSYLADTTHSVSVLHNGTGFLVADIYVDSTWVDCTASGVSKYDTLFNRIQFWGAASGLLAPSENDSFMLISDQLNREYLRDFSMLNSSYTATRNMDTTLISEIESFNGNSNDESIVCSNNFDFIVKMDPEECYLNCLNINGDTLWSLINFAPFSKDTINILGGVLSIDKDKNIYAICAVSRYMLNPNHTTLILQCFDSLGIQKWEHSFNSIPTDYIKITDDGKYMIGLTSFEKTDSKHLILWDLETFSMLFDKAIPNTIRHTFLSPRIIYKENTQELLIEAKIDNSTTYLFNKNGNEVKMDYPNRKTYTCNPNLAYEKDENRLIMYRVEWE